MLTTLNPLTLENVFNNRFPKIFVDRIAYEESINPTNEENSSLDLTINSHMFDFKNVDQMFNLLDDQELSSELVVNFLFTTTQEYDELGPDQFFKLSNQWLRETQNYHKFSFSLTEMFAFDLKEKEKLPKSILFDDADVNVHMVPLKSLNFSIPVAYRNGELSQQRLKLFVYFSMNENDLDVEKLSSNKALLSTFFGGLNEVEIVQGSILNLPRFALYDPESEKYWQKEAIYTSTDIPKAVPDFTPSEVASKYLSLVRSIKKDMTPLIQRQEVEFIADITTPYYTTKKDSFFVRDIALKIENLLVDSVGNQFRTSIVRRLVNFISGVDAQLEAYPTLELRRIGDGRIQRRSISFLEQANIGRITPDFVESRDYLLPRAKSFCVSELFYASDDDGSVEVYFVLNKTNMMKIYSPFYNYFPNFETLLPEAKSLFTIQEVSVTRDHAYSPSRDFPNYGAPAPENEALPIGRFIFTTAERSERFNDYESFEGYFTGRRERIVLQVQDTETTTLEGVEGESETSRTTTDTDIQEDVYETVDAITTGVAARLYTPNQFQDELILFSLNDQSVNASEEISTTGLIVNADDPLNEEDGNLALFLHYRFSAKYIDNTGVFLSQQLAYLSTSINELEKYLEDATEKCAFNDITDVFNDYFIDQQYRLYSDLALAPWNKLSAIFSEQMALFNRIENIDSNTIRQNAIEIKKLLDPKTATLDSIQTVLNAVSVFRISLRNRLIEIGAINVIPEVKGIVEDPNVVRDEIVLFGAPALDNWFQPKLSQYTGVERLETKEVEVDNRVEPLPTADDAIGLFVQAFAPRFRTWYNSLATSSASSTDPFTKLVTVAKYIVRKTGTFGLSDPLPNKGLLKLRFIRPWRNRSGRTAWKSKSLQLVLKTDISPDKLENEGRLLISMADFNNDSYELSSGAASANRAMQRLCHVMMAFEAGFGDFGGGSTEIRMVRPNRDSASDRFFHDNGYGGSSSQHLVFYNGNTKYAHKGSHNDYLTGNAKDILNAEVFKNSKSGVADRDGLVVGTGTNNGRSGPVETYETGLDQFVNLIEAYMRTLADVYDGFILDVDIMPQIKNAITLIDSGGGKGDLRELFKKVYNSGFFPWPGYPGIPDSLDSTQEHLFG